MKEKTSSAECALINGKQIDPYNSASARASDECSDWRLPAAYHKAFFILLETVPRLILFACGSSWQAFDLTLNGSHTMIRCPHNHHKHEHNVSCFRHLPTLTKVSDEVCQDRLVLRPFNSSGSTADVTQYRSAHMAFYLIWFRNAQI
jgi:hypothetical protein